MGQLTHHFFVCMNNRPPGHPKGSCVEKGASNVFNALAQMVEEKGLWGKVKVTSSGCLGPCHMGPVVVVYPEGVWYRITSPIDITEIIEQHVQKGEPVKRLQFDPEKV